MRNIQLEMTKLDLRILFLFILLTGLDANTSTRRRRYSSKSWSSWQSDSSENTSQDLEDWEIAGMIIGIIAILLIFLCCCVGSKRGSNDANSSPEDGETGAQNETPLSPYSEDKDIPKDRAPLSEKTGDYQGVGV